MSEPPSGIYSGVSGGIFDLFGFGSGSSTMPAATLDAGTAFGQLTGIDKYLRNEQARMKAYEEPKEYLTERKRLLDQARAAANTAFQTEYEALVKAREEFNAVPDLLAVQAPNEAQQNAIAKSPTGTIKYATNEELAQRAALKAQGDFQVKLEEINFAYPEAFGKQAMNFSTAKKIGDSAAIAFGLQK